MVDKSQNELEHLGPTCPDPSEARALSCGLTIKAMGFVMFCVHFSDLHGMRWVACTFAFGKSVAFVRKINVTPAFWTLRTFVSFTQLILCLFWCLSANCFWRSVARIKRNHFNMSATTEKSREVQKYHKVSLIVWHYFTIKNNSRNYTSQVSECAGFLGLLISSCLYQDWVVKQWYASHSLFSSCIWLFPADQAGPQKGGPPALSKLFQGVGHVCTF